MNLTSNGLTRQILDFYEEHAAVLESIAEQHHINADHPFTYRFCHLKPCVSFRNEFAKLAAEREDVIYLDLKTSGSGLKA